MPDIQECYGVPHKFWGAVAGPPDPVGSKQQARPNSCRLPKKGDCLGSYFSFGWAGLSIYFSMVVMVGKLLEISLLPAHCPLYAPQ